MSKDEAIRVLNELLLPLQLAGVECAVYNDVWNQSTVTIEVSGYRYIIFVGDKFCSNLVRMYNTFSFEVYGDNAELVMEYFRACLRNSERSVAGLLDDQDDTDPAL